MKLRTVVTVAALMLALLVAGYFGLRSVVFAAAEKNLLGPRPNGKVTPADFGARHVRFWIDSHGRRLEASEVDAICARPAALLIFHGRGESVSDWAKAQAFLGNNCVTSVVFDYSGFGNSTPPAHIGTLNEDAVAAYGAFVARFPSLTRRCVLGHSMGNAPMLHAYPQFQPAPDCVVVANAFSSVEDMARAGGAPAPLAAFLHGTWDNTNAIKRVAVPLLVVHGDADKTIPPALAVRIESAAPASAQRLTLHGFGHNALYDSPDARWWAPVLTFIRGPSSSAR